MQRAPDLHASLDTRDMSRVTLDIIDAVARLAPGKPNFLNQREPSKGIVRFCNLVHLLN